LTALAGPIGSVSSLPTRTTGSAMAAVPTFAAPYIAPELWEGIEADARADIFAVGAILYEMVTGKPAFEGKTQALLIAAITTVDPDPVSTAQPMAPPALDYVVKRCLTKDPRQRLQTAWDLMGQLEWIADGGTQVAIPAPVAARRKQRDRMVWGAVAGASLLALGLAPSALSSFRAAPEPDQIRFVVSNMGGSRSAVDFTRWSLDYQ
jgi:serine/threonine protein kinase